MLISCPSCSTSFAVPAKAIGENGRKLKCSKCSHVWFQKPKGFNRDKLDKFLEPTEINQSEDKNLPVKIKRNVSVIPAAIIVILLGLTFLVSKYKDLKYTGLDKYNSIKLERFYSKSQISDNKYEFKINGQIKNISTKKQNIPPLKYQVITAGGNILREDEVVIEQKTIEPNSMIDIAIDLNKISGNADRIKLLMPHWLENFFQ